MSHPYINTYIYMWHDVYYISYKVLLYLENKGPKEGLVPTPVLWTDSEWSQVQEGLLICQGEILCAPIYNIDMQIIYLFVYLSFNKLPNHSIKIITL